MKMSPNKLKLRSEKEMFELILDVATKDERIRAVYMNGSRTNPNVTKDIFQDYDIVYVVSETASFLNNPDWISVFGELLMIQEPDKNDSIVGMKMDFAKSYAYLMLFTDGNRIDLTIQTKEKMSISYTEDKLAIPLMDKDGCLPLIPPPTDEDYRVQRPTEAEYNNYTNEFWWCLQNVGKGLWRDELPYAKWMYEYTTRKSLDKMISWWIGINHDFQLSTGKLGKYFKKYLPEEHWKMYEATYSDGKVENMWDSIFVTCELFRVLSQDVAKHFGFTYPTQDDRNMTKYLQTVRDLPKDATSIF